MVNTSVTHKYTLAWQGPILALGNPNKISFISVQNKEEDISSDEESDLEGPTVSHPAAVPGRASTITVGMDHPPPGIPSQGIGNQAEPIPGGSGISFIEAQYHQVQAMPSTSTWRPPIHVAPQLQQAQVPYQLIPQQQPIQQQQHQQLQPEQVAPLLQPAPVLQQAPVPVLQLTSTNGTTRTNATTTALALHMQPPQGVLAYQPVQPVHQAAPPPPPQGPQFQQQVPLVGA